MEKKVLVILQLNKWVIPSEIRYIAKEVKIPKLTVHIKKQVSKWKIQHALKIPNLKAFPAIKKIQYPNQ